MASQFLKISASAKLAGPPLASPPDIQRELAEEVAGHMQHHSIYRAPHLSDALSGCTAEIGKRGDAGNGRETN